MKHSGTVWTYCQHYRQEDLCHYASPYYDPVKAHEYYMRTRKLKGRSTSANPTELEKIVDEYSQKQGEKIEASNTEFTTRKASIQRNIASLRTKYMGMNKEERARNKLRTQREIKALRLEIKKERLRIGRQLGIDLEKLVEEYGNRYQTEAARSEKVSSNAYSSDNRRLSETSEYKKSSEKTTNSEEKKKRTAVSNPDKKDSVARYTK